jgi:hypothetical protein
VGAMFMLMLTMSSKPIATITNGNDQSSLKAIVPRSWLPFHRH